MDQAARGQVLTFGKGFSLYANGPHDQVGSARYAGKPSATVVNQGTIAADQPIGVLDLGGNIVRFTNSGTVIASDGATISLGASSIANLSTGLIEATGQDSTLYYGGQEVSSQMSGSNAGTILVSSGATLALDTAISLGFYRSLKNTGGTVVIGGLLSGTGTIAVPMIAHDPDPLVLSGTISGLTLADAQGTLTGNQGVLDNVTCHGTLNIAGEISLAGTTLFTGSGGQGLGGVRLIGSYASLALQGGTLDDITITLGSSVSGDAILYTSTTLTLGAAAMIVAGGGGANIDLGTQVLNQGSIVCDGSSQEINFNSFASVTQTFINAGTITVSDGAQINTISQNDNPLLFENSGLISLAGGGRLDLSGVNPVNTGTILVTGANTILTYGPLDFFNPNPVQPWTNQGVISVSNGASLVLEGAFSVATLNSIAESDATIVIGSYGYDDTTITGPGTITVPPAGAGQNALMLNGAPTISGATISDPTGDLVATATFDRVTYLGTLQIGSAQQVTITNGLAMAAAGTGGGPGSIELFGGTLLASGSETVSNAIITVGSNSTTNSFQGTGVIAIDSGGVLTLAANTDLVQGGTTEALPLGSSATLVNQGTITAAIAQGMFALGSDGSTFTNTGSIVVSNGDTLSVAGDFTNLASGVLTGGSLEVDGTAQLLLPGTITSLADGAVVILHGAGAAAFSAGGQTLQETLGTIGVGSTLKLSNGVSFAGAQMLLDDGHITLGGATITEAGLDVGPTGALTGFGTVSGSLALSGLVAAQTGTLTIAGGVSGTGRLTALANATLRIESASSFSGTLSAAGTLAFLGALTNNAQLSIASGTASFAQSVVGAGTLQIGAAAEASLLAGAGAAQTIAFASETAGILAVGNTGGLAATIADFGGHDLIDLTAISSTSFSYAAGLLTLFNGASTVATLHFAGSYSAGDFAVSADAHGGTSIGFIQRAGRHLRSDQPAHLEPVSRTLPAHQRLRLALCGRLSRRARNRPPLAPVTPGWPHPCAGPTAAPPVSVTTSLATP